MCRVSLIQKSAKSLHPTQKEGPGVGHTTVHLWHSVVIVKIFGFFFGTHECMPLTGFITACNYRPV